MSLIGRRMYNRIALVVVIVMFSSIIQAMMEVSGNPVITENDWSDTFDDSNGVSSSINVNISSGDVRLAGYRNDFEEEAIGEIPTGWTREYGDAGSGWNRMIIENNPYELSNSILLGCNDDLSNFAWQKLWINFTEYYHLFEFKLILKNISPDTNRQGYFYIKFFNDTMSVYHEIRYYWDDGRSGIPSNSSTITAIDLIDNLPTGDDLGIIYNLFGNISQAIENNSNADLMSILDNTTHVRYGFYQDAGTGWDNYDNVYIDNLGIFDDINGNARSTEILLPPNKIFRSLIISKTEPIVDTIIEVSILNGTTNEIIPGFDNLLGTLIDISSIDRMIYPCIKLQANLLGTGNTTPILHDWIITWVNTTPPKTPTGFTISNPLNGYSLVLSWNSNTESDLADYRLFYSLDNISFSWLTDISQGTISFIHYGLKTGVTYFYQISAVDFENSLSPSSEVVNGTPDIDTDLDGKGNILDYDDDNDGIPDTTDPYPLNPLNDIEVNINDIQSILSSLNLTELQNDISNLSASISDQLTDLRNNITFDNDALRDWLDNILDNIDSNLTVTRATLEDQLNKLNLTIFDFHNDLSSDLIDIQSDIQDHDDDTGQDHSEIISYLEDLINNDDLQSQDLDGLKTMLITLAGDLSGHNQSMADGILGVVNDIEQFEEDTEGQMDNIEKTLEDLARLEEIIIDLENLNQALNAMNDELEESIEDKTKEEAIEDRVKFVEMLMMIVIILLIVNLVLVLVMGLRKGTQKDDKTKDLPPPEDHNIPPSSDQESVPDEEAQIDKPHEDEINEPPIPPPPE